MKNKKNGKLLIYVRYILPLASNVIIALISFIPCVTFTLNSDARESMSLSSFLLNVWTKSREYLFSSQTESTADGILFYKTVFIALIIVFLLFVLSFAVNLFSAITSLVFFIDDTSASYIKLKNVYLTFIPNRIVLISFDFLALPLLLFPHILVYFYRHILLYDIKVNISAIIPAAVYLVLLVSTVILTVFAKKYELRAKMNIFAKSKISHDSESENNEYLPQYKAQEQKLYRMNTVTAEEQRQKLIELLGYDESDKTEKQDEENQN